MGTKDIIVLGKKKIPCENKNLKVSDLKYFTENPRVYSVLNSMDTPEPSQEDIEKVMCSQEHVKQLKLSIESNGGLIDPIIVRDGDLTVLEGNSRLAAYRLLCETNPLQWGEIPCKVLPSDIGEDVVFALLGQYHIIGRKDWEPFEQAHYLYRRMEQTKIPVENMAAELGIAKGTAKRMVEVITFMKDNDDLNKRHWSYYEEYLKNAGIKKYRAAEGTELDETIIKAIKNDEIQQASDIRKIGDIAKVNDKQSKKVMSKITSGEYDIYEGYEELEESGKLDDAVKKLKRFRMAISQTTFENQLTNSDETIKNALFEIKKITKRLDSIQQKLGKQ